jgi:hypothetical protein
MAWRFPKYFKPTRDELEATYTRTRIQMNYEGEYMRRAAEPLAVSGRSTVDAAGENVKTGKRRSDGYCAASDIAAELRVPEKSEAIRKALSRLFDRNLIPDAGWIENSNPAKGQPKILYKLSVVRPLLAKYEQAANQ